jgi:putative ABC transport system substrate-binding protein
VIACGGSSEGKRRVAVIALEDVSPDRIKEGLTAEGVGDAEVIVRSAQNDLATLNLIARQVAGDSYAAVITLGTPALQAFASVNDRTQVPHVFAFVTDPESAGVGISTNAKPDHMTGIAAPEPTAESFQLARRMFPALARIGVAWNPSEANAQKQIVDGRGAAASLGLELLEASVTNSADVSEAIRALVGRGAEAIWLMGDATVHASASTIVAEEARRARIPVFSSVLRGKGVLFAYGLSPYEATRAAGSMAGRILRGEHPKTIPIVRMNTPRLFVDRSALQGLRDPWKMPPDVLAMAGSAPD